MNTAQLIKSKSLDSRLNHVTSDESTTMMAAMPINGPKMTSKESQLDDDYRQRQRLKQSLTTDTESVIENRKHTQIMVTSFAPEPKPKSSSKERQYAQHHLVQQTQSTQIQANNHTNTNSSNSGNSNNINTNNNVNGNANGNNNNNAQVAKTDGSDNNRSMQLRWPNGKSELPIIVFSPKVLRKAYWECKKIGGTV